MNFNDWCIKKYSNGSIGHSRKHRFEPYNTLILRRKMYYCMCGKKIKPEEYLEYRKYLEEMEKYIEAYCKNRG